MSFLTCCFGNSLIPVARLISRSIILDAHVGDVGDEQQRDERNNPKISANATPNGVAFVHPLYVVNGTDNVYELRNGSGVRVVAAQFGEWRGIFNSLGYGFQKGYKGSLVIANETTEVVERPATARPTYRMAHIGFEPNDDTPLAPVLTFVAWVVFLAIGLLGFLLPYSRPHRPVKAPESVKVQRLVVELSSPSEVPLENEQPMGSPSSSVPLPAEAIAPPPIAVAQPSAAIAFAVPVEGQTRVVPYNQATYASPSSTAMPAIQRLTFGQGEGEQPSPEYPAQAIQQHQEGTVVVRFVVGENGQISSAEIAQPCPWPLLNESVLRAARHQWRYPPGNVRVYEKAIRFQIVTK